MPKKAGYATAILTIILLLTTANAIAENTNSIDQSAFDGNTITDANACGAQQNPENTTYITGVSPGIFTTQDQNLSTTQETECYLDSIKNCIYTNPINTDNTLQWKCYDCTNGAMFSEGSRCFNAGETVCTDRCYCPTGHKCKIWYLTKITTGCTTCTDDCSQGTARCNGSYRESCGNYDTDSCFEWGNSTNCQYGCSSGQCNSTPACTNECSYSGQAQCNGSNRQVCGNYDADNCLEWNSTYCENGCESGNCKNCTSHYTSKCSGEDLYWFNSCNQQQEIKEDCRVSCLTSTNTCINGCKANLNIYAFDLWRNGKPNATVQYNLRDEQGWQYAGQTNSTGLLQLTKIIPFACGRAMDIKATTSEGAECSQQSPYTEKENDTDTIFLLCKEANTNNQLHIVATTDKMDYSEGETVQVAMHVSDSTGQAVQGVFIGVILSNGNNGTAPETDASGNSQYSFTAIGEGTNKILITASKAGYKNTIKEKTIRFEPISPWLVDNDGDGLNDAIEANIGTDPNDPNSNAVEVFGGSTDPALYCLLFMPFGKTSIDQEEKITEAILADKTGSMNTLEENLMAIQGMEQDETPFSEAIKKAGKLEAFEKKEGTIVLVTDEQEGKIRIYWLTPDCEGLFKGAAYGVTQGVTDDAALLTGIAYFAIYPEETQDILEQIQPTMNTIFSEGLVYIGMCTPANPVGRILFNSYCMQKEQQLGTALFGFLAESLGGITAKANEANTKYQHNWFEKLHFEGAFVVGYLTGYWTEQTLVAKGGESIGRAGIKAAGKILGKSGSVAVKTIAGVKKAKSLLPYLDETGQIGLGTVAKARKTPTSLELFLSGLDNTAAKNLVQKIGRIKKGLLQTMNEAQVDEAMEKMLNNTGYQIVLASYSDDVGKEVARIAGGSVRPWSRDGVKALAKIIEAKKTTPAIIENIDAIKNAKDLDYFLGVLAPQIDKSSADGFVYQLEKAANLQRSGKTVLGIEEKMTSGSAKATVDIRYQEGSLTKIMEVKANNFLPIDDHLINQLNNYRALVYNGEADVAELWVKGVASEEVKDFCNRIGIELLEGVG